MQYNVMNEIEDTIKSELQMSRTPRINIHQGQYKYEVRVCVRRTSDGDKNIPKCVADRRLGSNFHLCHLSFPLL